MKTTKTINAQARQLSVQRIIRALVLVCAFAVDPADAQVLVTDTASISTNQAGFESQLAKTIDSYRQQIQQYELQLQQYQQMLSSIQNIPNNLTLASNQLEHVTDTQSLIRGKCSGTSGPGGLVSTVMNSMSSLMTKSIAQTQQMLCGQIVTTQVHKYNATVDMLNKLNDYSGQFHQLDNLMNGGSSQADAERASTQIQKYNSAIDTEMGNWQAQMHADDAVISTLENQQSILGHVALKGSSTPLGDVVQAAAFATAFH